MWRVVVDVNMHTKFKIREKNSLLPTWYVGKMKQTNDNNNSHINDNNNSPHGKFHRFLFPFSSKFPYLNFTPYLLHSYPGYETRTRQNSEPRLPVAYAGLRDHQRLDLHRDS